VQRVADISEAAASTSICGEKQPQSLARTRGTRPDSNGLRQFRLAKKGICALTRVSAHDLESKQGEQECEGRDCHGPAADGGEVRTLNAGRAPAELGRKPFVAPIATPIPTLINNILLYNHFFVDIPSGNITGFANFETTLGGKWLELLSEIAPRLKRAAIMFNPDAAFVSTYVPSFETAARSLKLMSIVAPVHSDVEIETVIIALGREPGGGLVILPDIFMAAHRASIILAAARNNVPAVYPLPYYATDGGLLSYGPDQIDIWRRAATYVDRILRGASAAGLPVQLPTKFRPPDLRPV
jgi:hypothetical protein